MTTKIMVNVLKGIAQIGTANTKEPMRANAPKIHCEVSRSYQSECESDKKKSIKSCRSAHLPYYHSIL